MENKQKAVVVPEVTATINRDMREKNLTIPTWNNESYYRKGNLQNRNYENYKVVVTFPVKLPTDNSVHYLKAAVPKEILSPYNVLMYKITLKQFDVEPNGFSWTIPAGTVALTDASTVTFTSSNSNCCQNYNNLTKTSGAAQGCTGPSTYDPATITTAVANLSCGYYRDAASKKVTLRSYVNMKTVIAGVVGMEPLSNLFAAYPYCDMGVSIVCTTVDEVELIKTLSQGTEDYINATYSGTKSKDLNSLILSIGFPILSTYIDTTHSNPKNRDLINQILPDTVPKVEKKDSPLANTFLSQEIEKAKDFDTSKQTMINLFNRVNSQGIRNALVSLMMIDENISVNKSKCTGRETNLFNDIALQQFTGMDNDFIKYAARFYTKLVPTCNSEFFLDPTVINRNVKEFNDAVDAINDHCASTAKIADKVIQDTKYANYRDTYANVTSSNIGRVEENQKALTASAKQDQSDKTISQYLLQKLMSTTYAKLMVTKSFSAYVGTFDDDKCSVAKSTVTRFRLTRLPDGTDEISAASRLKIIKVAVLELRTSITELIADLLQDRTTVNIPSLSVTDVVTLGFVGLAWNGYTTSTLEVTHSQRNDQLYKKYLLSIPYAFKQFDSLDALIVNDTSAVSYKKFIQPASTREYLLSVNLIGQLLYKDGIDEFKNTIVKTIAEVTAVVGTIAMFTGVGSPIGAALNSASIILMAVATTATIGNAAYDWSEAVTEEQYNRAGGASGNKDLSLACSDIVTALKAQDTAIETAKWEVYASVIPVAGGAAIGAIAKEIKSAKLLNDMSKLGMEFDDATTAAKSIQAGAYNFNKYVDNNSLKSIFALSENKKDYVTLMAKLGSMSEKDAAPLIAKLNGLTDADSINNFIKNINAEIPKYGVSSTVKHTTTAATSTKNLTTVDTKVISNAEKDAGSSNTTNITDDTKTKIQVPKAAVSITGTGDKISDIGLTYEEAISLNKAVTDRYDKILSQDKLFKEYREPLQMPTITLGESTNLADMIPIKLGKKLDSVEIQKFGLGKFEGNIYYLGGEGEGSVYRVINGQTEYIIKGYKKTEDFINAEENLLPVADKLHDLSNKGVIDIDCITMKALDGNIIKQTDVKGIDLATFYDILNKNNPAAVDQFVKSFNGQLEKVATALGNEVVGKSYYYYKNMLVLDCKTAKGISYQFTPKNMVISPGGKITVIDLY